MNFAILFILGFVSITHSFALDCHFNGQKNLGKEVLEEINRGQLSCRNQSIHLTFDDGPSQTVTPLLLQELEKRRILATFFVTTTNLKSSHRHHRENRSLVKETMKAGHLVASHGHDHDAHDVRMHSSGKILESGFTQEEREKQVEESVRLLNEATGDRFSKQKHLLFRFPYGRGAMPSKAELQYMEEQGVLKFSSSDYATRLTEYRRQSPALQTLGGHQFSHLGWNNDSGDSSYGPGMPDQKVLKDYILKNIKSMCSGPSTQVALFHDIKLMNTAAIPVILDIGHCLGLKFISPEEMMKNKKSLVERSVLIENKTIQKAPVETVEYLLATISSSGTPECVPEEKKSCYSDYLKRWVEECQGDKSICHGGKWYSHRDQTVILKCNLTNG